MRVLKYVLLLLVGALAALAWSFAPQTLTTAASEPAQVPSAASPAPGELRIGVMHAGRMDSKALFAYRGGGFEERVFGMDVVVVEHPAGTVLFDAGFGRRVSEHAQTIPWLMRSLSKITPEIPVVEQLRSAGVSLAQIKGVVLTHAHWDHVSGLDDLRGVRSALVQLHALQQAMPDLVVVPAHDRRVMDTLPAWPLRPSAQAG